MSAPLITTDKSEMEISQRIQANLDKQNYLKYKCKAGKEIIFKTILLVDSHFTALTLDGNYTWDLKKQKGFGIERQLIEHKLLKSDKALREKINLLEDNNGKIELYVTDKTCISLKFETPMTSREISKMKSDSLNKGYVCAIKIQNKATNILHEIQSKHVPIGLNWVNGTLVLYTISQLFNNPTFMVYDFSV